MGPLTIKTVSMERTLTVAFGVFVGVLFLAYATYQARNLIQGPRLSFDGELGVVQRERAITLHGTARNVVILRLNGREIHTDEEGVFEHTLTLENGYTIMTLEAEDRYGRKTELTRSFIYTPQT